MQNGVACTNNTTTGCSGRTIFRKVIESEAMQCESMMHSSQGQIPDTFNLQIAGQAYGGNNYGSQYEVSVEMLT